MEYATFSDGGKVSKLSLGSWHIFPRLSFDDSVALIKRALDLGISFFDVGDYWDHDISNEERFGAVMRHLGVRRDAYQVAIKVFTNSAERRDVLLKESLSRLGITYTDFVICARPPAAETMSEAAESMADLVSSGLAKRLGFHNWTPDLLDQVIAGLKACNGPMPQMLQLQYSVSRRGVVESQEFADMFARTGIKLQAANTLEGGILAGHVVRERFHESDRAKGTWFTDRNICRDSGGIRPQIREKAQLLAEAARKIGATPTQLAMAFCLLNPNLATVLFGATRPEQLDENVGALRLAAERPDEVLAATASLFVDGTKAPPPFDHVAGVH